jgi:hypothetical protein
VPASAQPPGEPSPRPRRRPRLSPSWAPASRAPEPPPSPKHPRKPGAVHETGHALYEQGRNLSPEWRDLPVNSVGGVCVCVCVFVCVCVCVSVCWVRGRACGVWVCWGRSLRARARTLAGRPPPLPRARRAGHSPARRRPPSAPASTLTLKPLLPCPPPQKALSMGIHESQSLLWERMVALGPPFCKYMTGKARLGGGEW